MKIQVWTIHSAKRLEMDSKIICKGWSTTRAHFSHRLKNTIKIHKSETEYSRTLIGKILSIFGKRFDQDTLIVDGMRLLQCFELAGEEPPVKLHPGKNYQIGFDSFVALVSRASAKGRFGR
ncbi:MAG: hypothetical protein AAF423_05470 [Pseudomonadota bacterium]